MELTYHSGGRAWLIARIPPESWARADVDELGMLRVPPGAAGRVAVVSGLEEDEPVFVVRARDAGAITFLALYEATSARLFGEERAATLGEIVDAFVAWRREHAALVRDPD